MGKVKPTATGPTVVLRSPALYPSGEMAVQDRRESRRRGIRGDTLKKHATRAFYRTLAHAPLGVTLWQIRLLAGLAGLCYRLPGNHMRNSCIHLARIAGEAGHRHDPRDIYRALVRNFAQIAAGIARLHHGGIDPAIGTIDLGAGDRARIQDLVEKHGAAILAVPHNVGAVFASMRLARELPVLLVARNAASVERTRIALDLFEKMEVKICLVRRGNRFALTRSLLGALRDHRIVVATVDSVYRKANRTTVRIFGQEVGFAPWAARIAARASVPVVPTWVGTDGVSVRIRPGEPLVTDDPEKAVRHYVGFFEKKILEDPQSWTFLADNRWREILRAAAEDLE